MSIVGRRLSSCRFSVLVTKFFEKKAFSTQNSVTINHPKLFFPVSFAFSGCGWLLPFHLGVIHQMVESRILNGETLCAGSSGGAIAATIAVCGISAKQALEVIVEVSQNPSFRSDLDFSIKRILSESILTEEMLSKCNEYLYICLTRVWPNPSPNPVIISKYESISHLSNIISASCFIPLYSKSRSLTTKVHSVDGSFVDGGIVCFIPPIGDVKVAPIASEKRKWREKPHIYLDPQRYPETTLLRWALQPPPENVSFVIINIKLLYC